MQSLSLPLSIARYSYSWVNQSNAEWKNFPIYCEVVTSICPKVKKTLLIITLLKHFPLKKQIAFSSLMIQGFNSCVFLICLQLPGPSHDSSWVSQELTTCVWHIYHFNNFLFLCRSLNWSWQMRRLRMEKETHSQMTLSQDQQVWGSQRLSWCVPVSWWHWTLRTRYMCRHLSDWGLF